MHFSHLRLDRRSAIKSTVLSLALVILLAGCNSEQAAPPVPEPTVEVVIASPAPFGMSADLPGRIEPFRVAEVRARVAGIVLRRTFEEGSEVKAGQVLFEIDPAPYRAAMSRASAELAKAQSELEETRRIAKRYEPLVQAKAISQQDYDAARTNARNAEAVRQAAAASLETMRLDLKHATVTAPISGRIGRALVTEGALVGQGETTPLATIQQLDKVYADFQQPLAEMLRMREAMSNGDLSKAGDANKVSIRVEDTGHVREGTLLFSDVSVDRSTSQVSLRGVFENEDGLLLPGMFVRVSTPMGVDAKSILVPQRAVQRDGAGGMQVLVVDAQDTVEARPVTTGQMRDAKWQITSGLKAGDRVVVAGAASAPAGTKVKVKPAGAPAASAAAPTAAAKE